MFNAANILEALKNYIRTRGGTSNAYNIAEAVNDLNSIPQGSGGDIPDEVTNAIETHGMGWTEQGEQTIITWDGDTEGRDVFVGAYYKITDNAPQISTNFEKLIYNGVEYEITEDSITEETDHLIFISADDSDRVLVADADVDLDGMEIAKGVYFIKTPNGYTSSLTYGTPDTVHQIDEKYIPSAPEVTNAIETHGIGWTDEEVKEGYDIQWDGNTEGLDVFADKLFKVSENIFGINSPSNLINGTIAFTFNDETESFKIREGFATLVTDNIITLVEGSVFIVLEDTVLYDMPITKGIWFGKSTDETDTEYVTEYVSRLYKETATKEIIHQINEKYIPQMVVTVKYDDDFIVTADKSYSELLAAYNSGLRVIAVVERVDTTIARCDCTQWVRDVLYFGTPTHYADDGIILPTLKVHAEDGVDYWESNNLF